MSLSGIDPKGGVISVAKPNVPSQLFGLKGPADVDLLDPESMLAFFSQQMSDVRGKLSVAMKEQEGRNQLASDVQHLEAQLGEFAEKGVLPGDPRWDDFVNVTKQAIELLGNSNEGKALAANLNRLAGSGKEVKGFDSEAEAKAYQKERGGEITHLPPPVKKAAWLVVPAERDANAIKSMVSELKSFRDSIQNDNAMSMIRVQQLVENSSQLTNMCSNIMKKLSDMAMASINNLR